MCPYWKVSVVLFTAIEEYMRKLFGSTPVLCIHIYCWPSHSGGLYKTELQNGATAQMNDISIFIYTIKFKYTPMTRMTGAPLKK